ncbi:MAG TPA: TolC family protein, partial [Candidatus Polarisedimenticolia bacterium]|nr:TolC family protein [Candidatus Polarisedimenticolia bacterium]
MSRLLTAACATAAAAAAIVPAGARTPGPGDVPAPAGSLVLTQDEAVERALRASPTLRRLHAAEAAAVAGERIARSDRRPRIGLEAGYARTSGVPELTLAAPGQPERTIFPDIPDNLRSRVEMTLPLYTGQRVSSRVASARADRLAASLDAEAGGQDLRLDTVEAFWALAVARESVRVLTEALAAFDAHLAEARDRADVGLAARSEVLAVQVERNRAELGRLRAQGDALVAEADLARLIDSGPGTSIHPAGLDGPADP